MAVEVFGIVGFLIFFLEVTISTLMSVLLWRRWRDIRLPVIAILITLYIIFIGFVGVEFISFIVNISNPVQFYLDENNLIASLFPFYGGISAGIFLLFIEFFRKDRVAPIHTLVYGIFLGAFLLNMIFKVVFPEFTTSIEQATIVETFDLSAVIFLLINVLFTTNFPAAYFISYAIIVTLFSLQKIKDQVTEVNQKRQLIFLQATIIFFYGVPILLTILTRFTENSLNLELLVFLRHLAPHISVIIGSFFIYIAYVKAPLGLLQFHTLEKLLVINDSGLLLYSYDFLPKVDSDGDHRDRDVLFSGGVLAVLNLFTEMIETTEMQMIQFQEQIIMLSNNKNFITFLIADHTSRFLWNALNAFSQIFTLKFGSDAKELTVVPKHVFEDALEIVRLTFGL